MPLGLGPFLDQIVTLFLLIAAAIGGMHLYKKYEKPPQPAQVQAAPSAAPGTSAVSSEEILRERYARGEIDRPHYLEMQENLEAQPGGVSLKGTGSLSAEEIVRERYARGEINRSQFQEIMDELRNNKQ
jgi:uncharacterized membrane protein